MRSDRSSSSTGPMLPASAGHVPPRPNIQRNNRRSLYHPASSAGGNGIPEVYWSEGATPSAQAQNDPMTFYRDPTPEPDDERNGEKRGRGVVGVHGRGFAGDADEYSQLDEPRVCGVRRKIFWALVALALIVIMAIAIGVGVGVGMSTPPSGNSSPQESGDASGSSSAPPSASPTLPSTSPTTPSPSSDPSAEPSSDSGSDSSRTPSPTTERDPSYPTETSSGSLVCPHSNNTLYAVPGSPVRFLRLCDFDAPDSASREIGTIRTESMAECMRNCAGTFGCTGCGWGPHDGDPGGEFWCWLKGDLKGRYARVSGWEFAVMQ